jgi:hypothetical protein
LEKREQRAARKKIRTSILPRHLFCSLSSLQSERKKRETNERERERERETICHETIIAPCYFLFLLIVIKLERVFVLSFDDSLLLLLLRVCLVKREVKEDARAHTLRKEEEIRFRARARARGLLSSLLSLSLSSSSSSSLRQREREVAAGGRAQRSIFC